MPNCGWKVLTRVFGLARRIGVPDGDHFCDFGVIQVRSALHALAAEKRAGAASLGLQRGTSDARVWGRWELSQISQGSLTQVPCVPILPSLSSLPMFGCFLPE